MLPLPLTLVVLGIVHDLYDLAENNLEFIGLTNMDGIPKVKISGVGFLLVLSHTGNCVCSEPSTDTFFVSMQFIVRPVRLIFFTIRVIRSIIDPFLNLVIVLRCIYGLITVHVPVLCSIFRVTLIYWISYSLYIEVTISPIMGYSVFVVSDQFRYCVGNLIRFCMIIHFVIMMNFLLGVL